MKPPVWIVLTLGLGVLASSCGPQAPSDPRSRLTAETYVQEEPGGEWRRVEPADGSLQALTQPSGGGLVAKGFEVIGKLLWDIVSDSEFAANVSDQMVHVLPSGVKDTSKLTGWKPSSAPSVRAVFKDFLGDIVSDLTYRVHYHYGANYGGKGQYLSGVTLIPEQLNVKSLYIFEAKLRAIEPINVGSSSQPVPQMTLLVTTRIKDRFLGGEKVATDEIQIDGKGGYLVNQRSQ